MPEQHWHGDDTVSTPWPDVIVTYRAADGTFIKARVLTWDPPACTLDHDGAQRAQEHHDEAHPPGHMRKGQNGSQRPVRAPRRLDPRGSAR